MADRRLELSSPPPIQSLDGRPRRESLESMRSELGRSSKLRFACLAVPRNFASLVWPFLETSLRLFGRSSKLRFACLAVPRNFASLVFAGTTAVCHVILNRTSDRTQRAMRQGSTSHARRSLSPGRQCQSNPARSPWRGPMPQQPAADGCSACSNAPR